MSRQSSSSHASLDDVPVGQHGPVPVFDWREWLAFVGCVLGTALFYCDALIDWYKNEKKYQHINGLGTMDGIFADICEAVDKL